MPLDVRSLTTEGRAGCLGCRGLYLHHVKINNKQKCLKIRAKPVRSKFPRRFRRAMNHCLRRRDALR